MTLQPPRHSIPAEILALSHERDALRKRGQYERADVLKRQIEEAGYVIKDNPHGAHLVILPGVELRGQLYRTARQVPSYLESPDACTFSVNILARNTFEQTRRCVESVLRFAGDMAIELILVDNASLDEVTGWAEALQERDPRVFYARTTRPMGEAEARNLGLKLSRGRYILLLDSGIELTGDVFTPLTETLGERGVDVTGLRGLRTSDLRHFAESEEGEVEVVNAFCLAFKRSLLKQTGLFDERYRTGSYMDVDFNFAARDTGARAVLTPTLPLTLTPVSYEGNLPEAERQRLAKRNFYRFLEKWGDRRDLLLTEAEA